MDNFREWLSDNLRYILLGLAVILIIVVAIFAVKFIGSLGDSSTKPKESESQQQAVIVETEKQSEAETSSALVQDNPAILETVQNYYTAVANKDIDALKQLVESLDEKAQQAVLNNDVIESYNNISVYSKDGPVKGSYVVYPYYEGKLVGIDTLVPSLSSLYLCTNDDGTLYVADQDSDATVKAYIDKLKEEPDVKALIARVEEECKAAEDSDAALKAKLEELAVPETETVLPDSSEVDVEVNKVVQATDACNIRADSSEDAEIIGALNEGETITRVKSLDNGWSEVRYGSGSGYIKSDYLTENVSQ